MAIKFKRYGREGTFFFSAAAHARAPLILVILYTPIHTVTEAGTGRKHWELDTPAEQ